VRREAEIRAMSWENEVKLTRKNASAHPASPAIPKATTNLAASSPISDTETRPSGTAASVIAVQFTSGRTFDTAFFENT